MSIHSLARLLAVGTLAALTGCTGGASGDTGRGRGRGGPATPAVEIIEARTGTLPLEERLNGVVRAENQVSIRPEISGAVVEVMVRSGEAVERGQALVRLQDDTLREQVRQSEANVRLEEAAAMAARARVTELEAQVSRARSLAEESLISNLELETREAQLSAALATATQAEARVDQSRATLEERRSALVRTVVRSPVAGHVGRRNVEVGMLVDRNTLLFEVGNLDEVIVEVPITGEMLAYIKEGQPVRVYPAGVGDDPIVATLVRISPFLAANNFSTTGEIDVREAADRLRPGMFVAVDLLYGESATATLLPTTTLWEDPRTGIQGMYVVEPDQDPIATGSEGEATLSEETYQVRFRRVEVIAEGRAEVGVGGVEPGDWVVTVGHHLLRSDEPAAVRVRATTWEEVLGLQELQREDLLRDFLAKQQRLSSTQGAEVPEYEAGNEAPAGAKPADGG